MNIQNTILINTKTKQHLISKAEVIGRCGGDAAEIVENTPLRRS